MGDSPASDPKTPLTRKVRARGEEGTPAKEENPAQEHSITPTQTCQGLRPKKCRKVPPGASQWREKDKKRPPREHQRYHSQEMSKRQEMRRQRQAEARQKESRAKRIRSFALFAGVMALSAAFVVGAILLQLDKRETTEKDAKIEKLLQGIPQEGLRLGQPDAPRVLLEWGDMQCAACASFARDELPEIIEQEVRPGNIQIEFRQWPILGPDSNRVGRAALAASLQGSYWQFIEYYYNVQRPGESPSDELLEEVARTAGVLDIEKWKADMDLPRWEKEMLLNDEAAVEYGFSGTPSFAIKEGERITPLGISAPGELLEKLQD